MLVFHRIGLGSFNFMSDGLGKHGATATDEAVAIDIELVASSYRSMIDAEAFDLMMEAWGRRLDLEHSDAQGLSLPDTTAKQIKTVSSLLNEVALEPAEDPMSAAIGEFASAAMVLSPEHRVLALNTQAMGTFQAERGRQNKLEWLDPSSLQDFKTISQSAKSGSNAQHAIVKVQDPDSLAVSKLAEVYIFKVHGHVQDYLVVRLLDIPWSDGIGAVLMESFGLTESEANVCKLLYEVRDADLIAKARKSSLLTVRTQLKTILAKTNIDNRVELIRLLAMLCARQAKKGSVAAWSDPLRREQILMRPCGRRFAYTWFGNKKGLPVLMIHGPSIGPYFSEQLDQQMSKAGIFLVAPSRPGYGNSDPNANLSTINEQVEALSWFCQAMGFKNAPAIGVGCGIAPLLKMSADDPKIFSRLLQLGYFLPLDAKRIARQPRVQQTFFGLSKKAPWILETVIKIGFKIMLKKGIDWYLERAYVESAIDLATCRDPERAPLVRNGCAHMMLQGPNAFSRDLALVWEPVQEWVAKVAVPVKWIVGIHHEGFLPDEAQEWADQFAQCELEVVPNSGELLIYQKPDFVAQKIVTFARQSVQPQI
jgi:pimeloyl-ACP methyl ester carboxylesterase/DNA-binding CsgD family transcriptional regulator